MYIIKKRVIREVVILKEFQESFEYEVRVVESGIVEAISRDNVYESIKEAEMALKERDIVKAYKRSRRNKRGELTCQCCGAKGEDLTVDHVKALKSYGGKRAVRKDMKLWKEAWSYRNFQTLCYDCNQYKGSMSQDDFLKSVDFIDRHARRLNNNKKLKKSRHKNTPANKTSYGIATSEYAGNRKVLAEKVAKSDSNILRLDSVLQKMEVYETLPNTGIK